MIRLSDTAQLFHEDCREAIMRIPSDSLDSCVTDPPYALVSTLKRFANSPRTEASMPTAGPYARASRGFMGQTWDTGETAFSTEFWAEVYRVLKPGAFVAAFGASRGYHRMACAIEDAGFEIRDSLCWLYGQGFPKSQNVSAFIDKELGFEREVIGLKNNRGRAPGNIACIGLNTDSAGDPITAPATPEAAQWEGWGTALKPAFEPIVLARKPLSEKTVAANVLKWRTGALNIGACRVGTEVLPAQMAAQAKLGTFERDDMLTPERVGRWPANVVTDGSDEVVGMFPDTRARGNTTAKTVPQDHSDYTVDYSPTLRRESGFAGDSGSAARFFYSAKASKADRNGSKHPTVKPISLMEWLATLITPPGGTILDPFAGSGTTGAAARNKGFGVILCEREAEYIEDIKARFGFIESPPLAPLPAMTLAPPPY